MKTCNACKKEMADDAKFCSNCGTIVGSERVKEKWFYSSASLVVSFLVVGPFMLPLLWAKPGLSKRTKIIYTAIVLVLSYFIFVVFFKSLNSIISAYRFAGSV